MSSAHDTSYSFFLTVSGNRCGSTWLQSMLGAIPGTRSDFEICYRDDPPTPLHRSVLQTGVELKQVLMELAEAGVVRLGSKLVVAPFPSLSRRQIDDLIRRIPEDVCIIYISRSYFESFYSKMRGGGHWANPKGLSFPKLTKSWFRQSPLAESHPNSPIWVSPDFLQKDLKSRCTHEEGLLALASDRPFFLTEYRDIALKFAKIANFIGAAMKPEHVAAIIRRPGTLKIPPIAPEELITNWHQLIAIANEYEERRQELLKPLRRTDLACPPNYQIRRRDNDH